MVLSEALLAASRRPALRRAVTRTPATRRVVDRFVAGEDLADALTAVHALATDGIRVTLDHHGEGITTGSEAEHSRDAYPAALEGLAGLGLGDRAEVSVKLSAFGQALPGGHEVALERAALPAARGGQLPRRRQADRCRRRPAALRRRAGLGHQRQGRCRAEPSSGGRVPGRSRRRSCRRPTTATRT